MKYVILVFSIIISAGCFWIGFRMIRLYVRSAGWQRLKAIVTFKEIQVKPGNLHAGTANYVPVIRYTYTFGGRKYEQSHVFLENVLGGTRSFRKNAAEKILMRVPGDPLVWVNPSQPQQSVIFRNGIGLYAVVWVLGIVSLLVGISHVV